MGVNIQTKRPSWRSILFVVPLLVVSALVVLIVSLLGATSRPRVRVVFKGIERIYADRAFVDAALFSFTNSSKLNVTVFGWKALTAPQRFGSRRVPFYLPDDDTTNSVVFQGVRERVLKPGTGVMIAVPAMRGATNWQLELDYWHQGFRNKLALWLGPAKGGKLVPSAWRQIKTERFESERLPFVPEELDITTPGHRPVNVTLPGMRLGTISSEPRIFTNAPNRARRPW